MKVLVFGGRDYNDYETVKKVLNKLHREHEFTTVIHGDARGADSLGDRWAKEHSIPVRRYPAHWKAHDKKCPRYCKERSYCKRAGIRRNEQMRDEGQPDLAVGFPGGNGTNHMAKLTREAGIKTYRVAPR